MCVRDGRVALPDGISYRLLVLPDTPTMTPALVAKVRELVLAGATVVGHRANSRPASPVIPLATRSCGVWPTRSGAIATAGPSGNTASALAGSSADRHRKRSSPTRGCGPILSATLDCASFTGGWAEPTSTSSPIRSAGNCHHRDFPRDRQDSGVVVARQRTDRGLPGSSTCRKTRPPYA